MSTKTFPVTTLLDALHAARWRVVGELAEVGANPDPYVVQSFEYLNESDAKVAREAIKAALCRRLDFIDHAIAGLELTARAADVLKSMNGEQDAGQTGFLLIDPETGTLGWDDWTGRAA